MTPAQRWGAALKHQMTLQRVPVRSLARVTGIHPKTLQGYRKGRVLPRVQRAAEIADALVAPNLLALCTRLRTEECDECGRGFVRDQRGGNPQRWCSRLCSDRHRKRVVYAEDRRWTGKRYDAWKRKAERLQAHVDAMCRACEPDGACRTSDCPLRGASPFVLVEERHIERPEQGIIRHPPGSSLGRERRLEREREYARRRRSAV